MPYQKIDPPLALRSLVRGFWYLRLDLAELPEGFEILPDSYPEILFHFGSPCYLTTPTGRQRLPSPFVVGLLQHPIRLSAPGRVDFLSAQCFPWTPTTWVEQDTGPALAQLHRALAQAVAAGQITRALAQLTQHFLAKPVSIDHALHQAGIAMRAAHGQVPVGQLASAACATVRTLERKCRLVTGYSIKSIATLMRFEQVRNQLWRQPTSPLASLAQAAGYADQAHLSREFKRFSGTTPARFARTGGQPLPDGLDFVVFLQDQAGDQR